MSEIVLPALGEFTEIDRKAAAKKICFSGEEAAVRISGNHPESFVTIAIDCQQEIDRREDQLLAVLRENRELRVLLRESAHEFNQIGYCQTLQKKIDERLSAK